MADYANLGGVEHNVVEILAHDRLDGLCAPVGNVTGSQSTQTVVGRGDLLRLEVGLELAGKVRVQMRL